MSTVLAYLRKPEIAFVWIGTIWGSLFLLVTPPFQVPDENRHFYRAYQLSEGNLLGTKQDDAGGGELPESVIYTAEDPSHVILRFHWERRYRFRDTFMLLGFPLEPHKRMFIPFVSVIYSPIPYVPQVLGILPARLLELPPILMMYFGRIFNFATWLALTYLAIRITPIYKWLFALLALMPMSVFQAASLSVDAVTNGLAFLTIAFFLRCAFDEGKTIRLRDMVLLLLLTLCLSLCKVVYFLLVFLFLLIPRRKIGSVRRYLLLLLTLATANIIVAGLWNFCIRDFSATVRPAAQVQAQIELIKTQPGQYLSILLQTIRHRTGYLCDTFVGRLGWLDTSLPTCLVVCWWLLLAAAAILESRPTIHVTLLHKGILSGIMVITLLLMFTLMFIYWEPLGDTIIRGVQGRYLIPISPLLFMLLYSKRLGRDIRGYEPVLIIAIGFFLTVALLVTANRFYG